MLASYPSATGVVDLRNFGYEITALGARAMFHAKGVTEIHVPATVKKIETSALLVEDGANTKLFMYSPEPPILIDTSDGVGDDVSVFGSSISEIYVPKGSLNAYRGALGWENYKNNVTFKELGN